MQAAHDLEPPCFEALQIELSREKLENLFSKGELCVEDIQCLNAGSKKYLHRICLKTCHQRMRCRAKG